MEEKRLLYVIAAHVGDPSSLYFHSGKGDRVTKLRHVLELEWIEFLCPVCTTEEYDRITHYYNRIIVTHYNSFMWLNTFNLAFLMI